MTIFSKTGIFELQNLISAHGELLKEPRLGRIALSTDPLLNEKR